MTPEKLLTDFVKDIIKHPMDRQALIAGYAATFQSMLDKAKNEISPTIYGE